MGKPITQARLYNIALFYLSKYDASTQKVRQMLIRRLQKAAFSGEEVPPQANAWIEAVLAQLQNLGYIDDRRFAENQVRILTRQGKSAAFIRQKLELSGVSARLVSQLIADCSENDSDRALIWLKKHRKGGYRSELTVAKHEKDTKDLAALCRAGFSLCIAKEALRRSYTQVQTDDED